MFDSVIVAPNHLPKGFEEHTEWQSKSLDCNLDNYFIQEDGKLLKQGYYSQLKPEPYRFTGAINFHGSVNGEWIEMVALFKKGELILLELVEPID